MTETVTVAGPTTTRDYWLDPTIGDLLVIDDSTVKTSAVEAKLDEKTGA